MINLNSSIISLIYFINWVFGNLLHDDDCYCLAYGVVF